MVISALDRELIQPPSHAALGMECVQWLWQPGEPISSPSFHFLSYVI